MGLPSGVFNVSYAKDVAIVRTKTQWFLLVAGIVVAFCIPLFADEYVANLLTSLMIFVIAALGLQILVGYAGQISIGQTAFIAVGAYTSAILVSKFNLPFLIALPCSGIMAGVVGAVFGLPSLRLKGFYLVMATLAAQFIIMYVITHLTITGTYFGLVTRSPVIAGFEFNTATKYYYVVLPILIFMTYWAVNIVRSRLGRAFIAIRDSDLAAELLGINISYYKVAAFFVCCFYAGISGSLWAHHIHVVLPEQYNLLGSIWYLGYIIVGGLGSIPGTFFGTGFLYLFTEIEMYALSTISDVAPRLFELSIHLRDVTYGLIIILFVIFEPRGLAHRWLLIKEWWRAWPMKQRATA